MDLVSPLLAHLISERFASQSPDLAPLTPHDDNYHEFKASLFVVSRFLGTTFFENSISICIISQLTSV